MDNNIEILRELVFLIETTETKQSKELTDALSFAKSKLSKFDDTVEISANNCFRFAYSSNLLIGESDLAKIASNAERFNRDKGISGVMIHKDKFLIQLLEGPRDSVLYLINKIKNDRRHKNFKVIISTDDQPRMFPKWSLANFATSSQYFESIFNDLKSLKELKYALVDLENGVKPFILPKRIVRHVSH